MEELDLSLHMVDRVSRWSSRTRARSEACRVSGY